MKERKREELKSVENIIKEKVLEGGEEMMKKGMCD